MGDTVYSGHPGDLAPGTFARYFKKERRIFDVCVLLSSVYRHKRIRDELSIKKYGAVGARIAIKASVVCVPGSNVGWDNGYVV